MTALCDRTARVVQVGHGFLATCSCGWLDRLYDRRAHAEQHVTDHKEGNR